jgi:hypothetical protein
MKFKRNNEKIHFNQNYTKEIYAPEIPYSIKSFKKLTAALIHLAEAGPYAVECSKKVKSQVM